MDLQLAVDMFAHYPILRLEQKICLSIGLMDMRVHYPRVHLGHQIYLSMGLVDMLAHCPLMRLLRPAAKNGPFGPTLRCQRPLPQTQS